MKVLKYVFLIISIIIFSSCEDILTDYVIEEGPERYVIVGLVTSQPGPYEIRVNKTAQINSKGELPVVDDAQVIIKDDIGNADTLLYAGNGVYQTTSLQGVVGRTYQVVVSHENNELVSAQERLNEVAPLDSVYAYKNTQILGGSFLEDGYYIIVNYTEPPGPDFYRWKLFENDSLYDDVFDILVEDDQGILDGAVIEERPFANWIFNPEPNDSIKITLERSSLSKSGYDFWLSVVFQGTSSGGPFDTPPAPIQGNMRSNSNPREQVLGYFGASDIYSETIYIKNE